MLEKEVKNGSINLKLQKLKEKENKSQNLVLKTLYAYIIHRVAENCKGMQGERENFSNPRPFWGVSLLQNDEGSDITHLTPWSTKPRGAHKSPRRTPQ